MCAPFKLFQAFFTHAVRKEIQKNEVKPTSDTLLIASASHLPVTPPDQQLLCKNKCNHAYTIKEKG